MNKLRFPEQLTASLFLRDYWQRRPLLFRAALPPAGICELTPDELAGLACEESIEARIVLERDGERPWEVRHGPFGDEDFAALPDSHWTLLVQDVDKYVPSVAQLLGYFDFLPEWRVDDVMISYAPLHGSVGPHVDEYDVFLIQSYGRRRWLIEEEPSPSCLPDLDLRILSRFEANREWILEPGDMLYLPPGVGHHGIALEDCMTCSVGFRAPSYPEMISAFCDQVLADYPPGTRYRDPPLKPQRHRAEIQAGAMSPILDALSRALCPGDNAVQRWFGRFVTEPKAHLLPPEPEQPLGSTQFLDRFHRHGWLRRHPATRLVFLRLAPETVYLYVNGAEYCVPEAYRTFVEFLGAERAFGIDGCAVWLSQPTCLELLTNLYNAGCYEFDRDR